MKDKNTVSTKGEALDWFLRNPKGSVICIEGDKSKRCYTFLDAVHFFDDIEEEKAND